MASTNAATQPALSFDADERPKSATEVLRDLKRWMENRLKNGPIESRGQRSGYAGAHVQSGYVAVLIPDWEMKQKLESVSAALAQKPRKVRMHPSIHPTEAPRLTRQCAEILAAFRADTNHRQTNQELVRLALKYTSRLSDLRAAGYQIDVVKRDRYSGQTIYELKEAT
jgi:hypothetical protein